MTRSGASRNLLQRLVGKIPVLNTICEEQGLATSLVFLLMVLGSITVIILGVVDTIIGD